MIDFFVAKLQNQRAHCGITNAELKCFIWGTGVYEYLFLAFAPDRATAFEMIREQVTKENFPRSENATVHEHAIKEVPIQSGVRVIPNHDWMFND